jgi:hypothetical protein
MKNKGNLQQLIMHKILNVIKWKMINERTSLSFFLNKFNENEF